MTERGRYFPFAFASNRGAFFRAFVDLRSRQVFQRPPSDVVSLLLTLQVNCHSQVSGAVARQAAMYGASACEDGEENPA
jgi:hypothetical protein